MSKKSSKKIADSRSQEAAEMPSFSLSSALIPEIKDWKVGQKYTISLDVKLVTKGIGKTPYGFPMNAEEKAEKEQYATFKVLDAESDAGENEPDDEGSNYDSAQPMNPLNHPLNKGSKSAKK